MYNNVSEQLENVDVSSVLNEALKKIKDQKERLAFFERYWRVSRQYIPHNDYKAYLEKERLFNQKVYAPEVIEDDPLEV